MDLPRCKHHTLFISRCKFLQDCTAINFLYVSLPPPPHPQLISEFTDTEIVPMNYSFLYSLQFLVQRKYKFMFGFFEWRLYIYIYIYNVCYIYTYIYNVYIYKDIKSIWIITIGPNSKIAHLFLILSKWHSNDSHCAMKYLVI